MLEPWQKKAVVWRAIRRPSRLTLLLALLGAAVIINLVFNWFWLSISILSVVVIGYIVWFAVDIGHPVHIVRSVLGELSGFSGLSHRFKSRISTIERVFVSFWEKTDSLNEEMIEGPRREAFRATMALAARLRAVGLADRVNRETRRAGRGSDRAEDLVARTLDEVDRFIEKLNQTAVSAAEVALMSREEALSRMKEAAEELVLWRESLREAKIELDEAGL